MQDINLNSPEVRSLVLGMVGGVALLTFFVALSFGLGMSDALYTIRGIP